MYLLGAIYEVKHEKPLTHKEDMVGALLRECLGRKSNGFRNVQRLSRPDSARPSCKLVCHTATALHERLSLLVVPKVEKNQLSLLTWT